jgi:hypothetical protein
VHLVELLDQALLLGRVRELDLAPERRAAGVKSLKHEVDDVTLVNWC